MVQASGACQWYGSLVTMDKDWTWNDLYYSRAPTLLTSILSWTQETIFLQLTHSLNSNGKLYWRRVTLFHDMDLYWPKMYLCTFQDLLWGIWMTSIGRKCICVFARICFEVFEWPLLARLSELRINVHCGHEEISQHTLQSLHKNKSSKHENKNEN